MSRAAPPWTQVPPCPSSSPPQSLLTRHPLKHIWILLLWLYTNLTSLYPALSGREAGFERVCVAAEDHDCAIKNEEEGCGQRQAAARAKESCESPPQLWTWERRYCKFYHGYQRCVILCYLTDLSACAWNSQLLYLAFNSVAYLYLGHLPISTSLVLVSGEPCL